MGSTIAEMLRGWRDEDLQNLASLVDPKYQPGRRYSPEEIEEAFKWQYYSRTAEGGKTVAKRAFTQVKTRLGAEASAKADKQQDLRAPSYEVLIREACRHEKAHEDWASTEELELFLAQAIILRALQHMKPGERAKFFEQEVEVEKLTGGARIRGPKLGGPMTTFAMLGAAQMSGFGVYLAATTALGLVTHAVGMTLPFAVYTGMTSSIAFIIGPAGWLAAGAWGMWRLTQPRWKRAIPGLLYITAVNARRRLDEQGGPSPVVCAV